MNTLAFICLLFGSVMLAHATYGKQKYSGKQVFCYDYIGRQIRPGQSYYDGCNTCLCGPYGMPTICTLRYCGYNNVNTGRPVYPVNPVNPVNMMNPVYPALPMYPTNPIKQYPRRRY